MQAAEAPVPVISEKLVIGLISAVQFINILEFMMVMPLGPDFAKALGIHVSKLGMIGGSYTAAAAVSGVIASTFVEKFDRRKALATAMLGLIVATCAAGLATDLHTLMAARILAGVFGGPASALSLAIIADVVAPERRGKAMGTVMASLSLASIVGVPIGLELARVGSWRLPFYCVAGLGVVVVTLAIAKLPSLTGHLKLKRPPGDGNQTLALLSKPTVQLSLAMGAFAMMGMFLLIPNLAAYVQGNLGFPREQMSLLYLVGGAATFVIMRFIGKLTDRYGPFPVATVGTLMTVVLVYIGFVNYVPGLPVMAIFVGFMVSSSTRNVPFNALTSMVPAPQERARFMSIQSSVQHISCAAGAFLSSMILYEVPGHGLGNVDVVAFINMALCVTMPFFMRSIQARLRAGGAVIGTATRPSSAPAVPAPVPAAPGRGP